MKYLAVVSRSPEPSDSGMMVCTEPLPKLWVPSTTARPQSWSAPATISDAEALPWLTSTTIGKSVKHPLGVRGEAHVLVAHAALGVDHELAGLEELLGHLDRGGEQAARIVAQVEHEALDLAVLGVLLERGLQVVARSAPGTGAAGCTRCRGSSWLFFTDCTRICSRVIRKSFGSVQPSRTMRDRDLAARLAAHALDRVGELHVLGGEALDLQDAVAGLDARAVGRRALDGRDHGQHVVPQRDLDAEARRSCPLVSTCISRYISGSRNEECGSSPRSVPLIAL